MPERLPLFATAARGTEDLLAEELNALGAAKVRQGRGGVRFSANLHEALRICLWSRIAMRVLYPLGELEARGAEGLHEAARGIRWEDFLTRSTTFAVEATLRDSEHTHSGFVALKIKDAIVDRLRDKIGARPDVDTRHPTFNVVAHLAREQLSLSFDLCGDPLNRRGYRVQSTVAPLKESLAAAILRAAKFTGDEPLLDPMCGSGTFAIEGALIATRRAPGLERGFAVERWPSMKGASEILSELRSAARAELRSAPHPIVAFDKDEDAVAAARKNVNAAGMRGVIRVEPGDALALDPASLPAGGLLVTNPPYGDRLKGGGQKGMKSFYFKLGEQLAALRGWRMAVLSGNEAFESAFHQRPIHRRALWNGPIACELLEYAAREPGSLK